MRGAQPAETAGARAESCSEGWKIGVNISLAALGPSAAMGSAPGSDTHPPHLEFYRGLWGGSGEETNWEVPYGHCDSLGILAKP